MAIRSSDWFSAFWQADRQIWKDAAEEVITIGLISIVPLLAVGLAGDLGGLIDPEANTLPFGSKIWQAVSSGQLLFYAISFVATIIFYASKDFKKNFPLRLYYFIMSFFFCIFAVLLIGVDPSLEKLGVPAITWTSIAIYFVCAIMYWTITIFKEIDPSDYLASLREGEDQALHDLEERRKGK